MRACGRCAWPYPPTLMNHVAGSLVRQPVCGICALDIINAIHGTKMTELHGEQAEQMRQDALLWREQHPETEPPKGKQ